MLYNDEAVSKNRFRELLEDITSINELSKKIVKYPNPTSENYLVADIETYPNKTASEFVLNYFQEKRWNKKIPKEKKLKKSATPEEMAKVREESAEAIKEYENAIQLDKCIEPSLAEIILINLKSPHWRHRIYGEKEKLLLKRFWDIMFIFRQTKMPTLVSFNGINFDAPMIELRSSILGVDKFSLPKRRYDTSKHFDVRMVLTNWNQYGMGNLTFWGEVFGFKRPENFVEGCDLAKCYENGDMKTIIEHCDSDIDLTENIFLRLL